jgi:vacuolar-type H+-ATPase subunit I/STV1
MNIEFVHRLEGFAIFLILGCFFIHWVHTREKDAKKKLSDKCRTEFYELKEEIRFAPSRTSLAAMDDKILDVKNRYYDVPESKLLCSQAFEALNARRNDLRNERARVQ